MYKCNILEVDKMGDYTLSVCDSEHQPLSNNRSCWRLLIVVWEGKLLV